MDSGWETKNNGAGALEALLGEGRGLANNRCICMTRVDSCMKMRVKLSWFSKRVESKLQANKGGLQTQFWNKNNWKVDAI
jgi:hypothetical protein